MTVERYLMEALKSSPVYVEDVFSTYLYTGNSSTQTITNNIDLSTKGGLVWAKCRSAGFDHALYDTARGATQRLASDTTDAQSTYPGGVTAFNTTGFSIGNNSDVNFNNATFASWTFRKQPKFFDIVTYTGDGTNNRQIVHALGATPGMVIVKCTSSAAAWPVWHRSLSGSNYNLYLNTTISSGAQGDFSSNGSVSFSSTTFPVSNGGLANSAGQTYVAYLFADQAGGFGLTGSDSVVACGSFTAGSSGLGTVTLGWEPQYILFKRTNTTQNWYIWDVMRGMSLTGGVSLSPNLSDAEYNWASSSYVYPTATGFAGSGDFFGNGANVIYMAIRRGPMKVPTSGTSVYQPIARTGTTSNVTVTSSLPVVDAVWSGDRQGNLGTNASYFDRLRGATYFLRSSSTNAEIQATDSLTGFDVQYGYKVGTDGSYGTINYSPWTYVNWVFRRAPGFFDEVCYTGTGSATTQAHNLGVAPELIIIKTRSGVNDWYVQSSALPSTTDSYIFLNSSTSVQSYSSVWTVPTTTTFGFQLGAAGINSLGSTYVAYLFATCPGVSKVGSYTGTATAQNIDCGFAAGARFILIKRTDSTGDWYVYDSARGISSSNDPYLLLNSTAAEVTGTNYVDTYATGFSLTASAPAALNANGGSYIFLAVA